MDSHGDQPCGWTDRVREHRESVRLNNILEESQTMIIDKRMIALLSIIILGSSIGFTQQNLQENQFRQFGATQTFGVDSVDLTSLAVGLEIPILTEPGRGENLNLRLSYQATSIGAQYLGWTTPLQNLVGRGDKTILGCSTSGCGYKYTWADPFGTSHAWSLGTSANGYSCTACVASDGSGLILSPGTNTITAPDGASWNVIFSSGTVFSPGGYAQDANGNRITETSAGVTDTLGHSHQVGNFSPLISKQNITCTAGACSGTPPPSETYSYIDSNGASQTVAINYQLVTVDSLIPPSPCASSYQPYSASSGLENVPSSIAFPNGTRYAFTYEASTYTANQTTGRLAILTLPTGGTVTYAYPSPQSIMTSDQNCADGGVFFLTRTTSDGKWTFTRTLSNYGDADCVEVGDCPPPPTATTTVTDPKGNVTVYTFFPYTFGPFNDYTYFLTSKAVYQGAGTGAPLIYEQICYNGFAPPCANETAQNMPSSGQTGQIIGTKDVYTALNGGASSRVTTKYGWPLEVPVEVDEYDFGAATAMRKTLTGYYTMNGVMSSNPTSIVVEDASNNVLSQTQYHYDETTAQSTSAVVQHFAVAGQRGNLTSELHWNNVSNSWLSTTYTNDDAGNRISESDANGNPPTKYSYSDSWYSMADGCAPPAGEIADAFLTTAIDSLGHKAENAYDACTGLLRQQLTPNDIANNRDGTITSYDDANNVLTVTYPDGGSTANDYGNYAMPLTIKTTTVSTPSPSRVVETVLDGYGRVSKMLLLSDASGAIQGTRSYDGDGLVYSVTTPYRSSAESSYGQRYYYYDALGRKITEVAPDGTRQTWQYSGSTVTFNDENGNQWTQTADAFGRLVKVLEPNGTATSPSLETDYSYNSLNALLRVDQWGGAKGNSGDRVRTFSFDSLSQLICASNPETATGTCPATTPTTYVAGTTGYTYDQNGNLVAKTEPAVNAPTGTRTSSYCYDALDRLTYKFYSGSANCSAPTGYAAAYAYDGNTLPGTTIGVGPGSGSNTVGQMTEEQYFIGSTLVSERALLQYDPMGRLEFEQQAPFVPGGAQYNLTYAYDLSGNLTSRGNTGTGITIGYAYDGASRLSNVTSSLTTDISGTTYPPTLYSVSSYSPVGVAHASYGGDSSTGIFDLYRYYDSRSRVTANEVYPLTDAFGKATVTVTGTENTCVQGSGSSCVADTGTVSATAGNVTITVSYGSTSSANGIASALASGFNHNSNSPVSATISSSSPTCTNGLSTIGAKPCSVVQLTAIQVGAPGDVRLVTTGADSLGTSVTPSFTGQASGTALTGGSGTAAYTYTLAYDSAGNVYGSTDTFNGNWKYSYDTLNRLSTAQNVNATGIATPNGVFPYQCWGYDAFGDRTGELDSLSSCPASMTATSSTHWAIYSARNRIQASDTLASGPAYDAAGNVTNDGVNKYIYDPEGRLCGVLNIATTSATQYVYDADGRRVAKGALLGSWPVSGASCGAPTSSSFSLSATYVRGKNGDQEVELQAPPPASMNEAPGWHQNVYAGGTLIATYGVPPYSTQAGTNCVIVTGGTITHVPCPPPPPPAPTLSFHFGDWVGSRRMQVNAQGQLQLTWQSDPFGDYQAPSGSGSDATEHHFTGKERDSESGNDYFGARYYNSSAGRFLMPDPGWSLQATTADPQSWNEYAYVQNNPLTMVDPDGTCGEISAGIGMSPDSPSGAALIDLAIKYGFNVAFPYAGEDREDSVWDIAHAGDGANGGATATASAAVQATNDDEGGAGRVFLGFSGGGQANVSAGVNGAMGTVAFYDPGLGVGQKLPAGSWLFKGNGAASDAVNKTAGTEGGYGVPNCGHDVLCAIHNSDLLRSLLQAAGPCNHPKMFVRNRATVPPNLPGITRIPVNRLKLKPKVVSLPACHTEVTENYIYDDTGHQIGGAVGRAKYMCQAGNMTW
jgi:RHS repeat-associated protein